jgi:hypothetical protein
MAAFYGGQLVFRDHRHAVEMFFAVPPDWLNWLPSAWLAQWVALVLSAPPLAYLCRAAAALLVLLLMASLAVLRLMAYYRRASWASVSSLPARSCRNTRPFVGSLVRWLAGPSGPAAPLALCFAMLRRDPDLRSRTLPAFATMLAFLAVGLVLKELGDPFGPHPERAICSIAVVQLGVLAAPTILHNMRFCRDSSASWLLQTAPQSSPLACSAAMRLAACYGILLPVFGLLWLGFSLLWQAPLHAAAHCAVGWLGALIASHLTLWGMRYPLPFSQPAARGAVTGPVMPYLAGVGTLAAFLGFGQYYASQRILAMPLFLLALGALALGAEHLLHHGRPLRKSSYA